MGRKLGFTLAEVLITLGIIGVVSSMTIPTLVQNYNTRAWNTAATVFDRKLEEALKTMNTQSTLAGHTTTESFVDELSKHFKINKICQNDELLDCFSETVYWGGGDATPEEVDMTIVKKAKNFGQKDWGTNIVGVQFANGTSALIAYNPTAGENACTQDPFSNQITGSDCLAILYDTSANKNPNTSGKDLRANGNVKKLGSGCSFKIGTTCYGTPFHSEPISKQECESLHLPYCNSDEDYWAGAAKACGGRDKMPTMAQLAAMANYIYGTTSVYDFGNISSISMDQAKASALGFIPPSPYTSFDVWSNQVYSDTHMYYRGFSSTYTYPSGGLRSNNSVLRFTVCLENE